MPKNETVSGKKKLIIEVYSDEYDIEVVNHHREMEADDAKAYLGWKIEAEGEKEFGEAYALKDREGNKVQLLNNATNRPYSKSDAERNCDAMQNGLWALNGETMTIDDKGQVVSAQHRQIGLVLANQARKGEGKAKKVTIPAIVVKGISAKKEVVDTADTGRSRKLADVVFRNKEFGAKRSPKELKGLAKDFSVASRLAWLRTNGSLVSGSGRFEHVEAVAFQKKHPLLKECVTFVFEENGGNSKDEGRKISRYVSLGYAGALMYLMATSKTKLESGEISDKLKAKAEEFWTLLANGGTQTDLWGALRKKLADMAAGSGSDRDEICGVIIKAWELFVAGKADSKVSVADISIKRKVVDGKKKLAEIPRLGGLDVAVEASVEEVAETTQDEPEAPSEAPTASKGKAKGKGSKGKSKAGSASEDSPVDSAAAPVA